MSHDPLCPWRKVEESDGPERWFAAAALCECDLIRQVRKDENRKVNHLRRRIERLTDKANNWRDESVAARAAAKTAHDQACDECLNAIEQVMGEYVGDQYKQGQIALGTAAESIRVYVKGGGRP